MEPVLDGLSAGIADGSALELELEAKEPELEAKEPELEAKELELEVKELELEASELCFRGWGQLPGVDELP